MDVHITRMQLSVRNRLLLNPHLDDLFHRDEDFGNELTHFLGLDPLLDALLNLLLLAGESMDHKPLVFHAA